MKRIRKADPDDLATLLRRALEIVEAGCSLRAFIERHHVDIHGKVRQGTRHGWDGR